MPYVTKWSYADMTPDLTAAATSGFCSRYHWVSNSGDGARPSSAPYNKKCSEALINPAAAAAATSGFCDKYQVSLKRVKFTIELLFVISSGRGYTGSHSAMRHHC